MTGRSLMVIGGSGFFGKSILDAHARGRLSRWNIGRIIVVARSATALARTHPALVGPDVHLHDADVGIADHLPQADLIIHAASSTDAQRYIDAPDEERANILAATDNFCRIVAGRATKIVYASSGAVYGQMPATLAGVAEDYQPGAVDDLVAYKRDYAEAKREAEARIAALGQHGVATAVARCFAFIGTYLPRDQHFAIGNFLADGLARRPIGVQARHAVYRSYMHADDLVDWLMTIADAADLDCPVYNVGSNEAVTMGDAARIVAARFGVAAQVPDIASDRVDRYIPAIDKARQALDLDLSHDLRSAVDDIATRLIAEHDEKTQRDEP